MVEVLSQRLVPDGLWASVEPLLPKFEARAQGGGTSPVDERAVFTAVVFVLSSGCAWRMLQVTGVTVRVATKSKVQHRTEGSWLV